MNIKRKGESTNEIALHLYVKHVVKKLVLDIYPNINKHKHVKPNHTQIIDIILLMGESI